MTDTSSSPGIVFVTTRTEAEGRAIAQVLLNEKLAACVNLFPIQSLYIWDNALQQDSEWQLLIKTDLTRFSALESRIRELHTYEVPEMIAVPIALGSYPYLSWLKTQTLST